MECKKVPELSAPGDILIAGAEAHLTTILPREMLIHGKIEHAIIRDAELITFSAETK